MCNSMMSDGIMLVYHRFGESSSPSLSLPGFPSHSLALWSLVFWSSGWKGGISLGFLNVHVAVSFSQLGLPTGQGSGWEKGFLKKMGMLPAYSGPQLPFLNSSGQKDRKPTALTHYRSALCKTQTKKEVKEKSVTPILSGPQGSPFLVLWTER